MTLLLLAVISIIIVITDLHHCGSYCENNDADDRDNNKKKPLKTYNNNDNYDATINQNDNTSIVC